MRWKKFKTSNPVKSEHQLKKIGIGVPFLGYSKSWEHPFNPQGIRECFVDFEDGVVSAVWQGEEWVKQEYSQPTHFCLYKKPRKSIFSLLK